MSKAGHRRWAALCLALALLACLLSLRIVWTNSHGYLGSSWKGHGTAAHGVLSAAFQIHGNALGSVSPGTMVPLDLTFTNPHLEPMTVTQLRITVRKLSAPGADGRHPCSVRDYELRQISSSVKIVLPPSATIGLADLDIPQDRWPQVGMIYGAWNQDGCRGAALELGYTAFGTLVT